jgi:hypothetical protein
MRKKKICLKLKDNLCPICNQKMDLCVISHKNRPFIDNKLYPKMCFTCYSVPKIYDQKYDENGYIKEEKTLDYNFSNLHTPQEIFNEGSADSLEQAKKCVKAIKDLKVAKEIKNKTKPKLDFYLMD